MAPQRVSMLMLHMATPRDREAHDQLSAALADASVSAPDEAGSFDVTLDAPDLDHALQRVWDAVAESGTDDHIAFLEHPDLPEHWRHLSRRPAG